MTLRSLFNDKTKEKEEKLGEGDEFKPVPLSSGGHKLPVIPIMSLVLQVQGLALNPILLLRTLNPSPSFQSWTRTL